MVKVSVVIPAYNALSFLPETVASALAQSYSDLEVLIVNDGSSDGTDSWLAQLDDPRVRHINQANLGQPGARNTGITHTTGEYLAFLDADDLWATDKLAKQFGYLEAHPEVGLIHTSVNLISEQGDSLRKTIFAHGHGDLWREIAAYNPYFLVLCGSTPVIRRSCFETVGVFDETLQTHEDWDMWIRIAEHYPFATLQEPLVFYRQHPTNVSKNYQIMMGHAEAIIEKTFAAAKPEDQKLRARAYARTYLFAAWQAFGTRNYREAGQLHRQALSHWPRLYFVKSSLRLSLLLSRANLRRTSR